MKRKLTLGLMLSAVLFLSSCMNGVDNEKKGFISISIDDLSRSSYKALPVYDLDDPNHEYTFELTGKAEGDETTKTFSGINYANGNFSFAQTPSVSLGIWDFTFKIFRKENSVDKLFLIGTTTSVEIVEGNNSLNFAMKKASVDDAGQNGLPNGSLNIKVKFPSDRGTTRVEVAIKSSTNSNFPTEPVTFNQEDFTSSDEEGISFSSFEYTMDDIPAGYYYLNLNFFNENILLCSYPILVQIESGAVSYINGNKEDVLSILSLEKIYYLTFKYETDNGTDEIKVAYNIHSCVNLENLNEYIGSLKNGYEIESWNGYDSDNNEVSFPSDGKWNSSFSEERNVTFTANLKPIEYNITYNTVFAYTKEDGSVESFEPEEIPDINFPQEKFPSKYNIESTHTFEENFQLDGYLYISDYLVGGESFSAIEQGSTGDLEITIQVVQCYVGVYVENSSGTKLSTTSSEDGESYYNLTQNEEYTLVYKVRPYHKDFDNPIIKCSMEDIYLNIGDVSENVEDGYSERRVTFRAPQESGADQDFSVILELDDSAQGQLSLNFKVKGTGTITLDSSYLTTNDYTLNEGVYKVTEDISLTQQIVVNGEVTIFAEGDYSITSSLGVFNANSATKLTLGTGNSNNNNLKIKNISTTPAVQTSSQYATTIEINDGVSFEECENSYCISFISPRSLTVNGGSFKNNKYGAILLSNSSATVEIKGGEISNNNCPSENYAIQVFSGSLSIEGGSVRDNTVNGVASGAAINNTNGTVSISGYDSELTFPFVKNIVDGEVQEDSTSGSEGTDLGIVYSGSETRGVGSSYPLFTISSSKGLKIFRDIVNGTLLEEGQTLTIPSDPTVENIAPYSITNTNSNPYIDGKLANDIELSFEEGESWTPIGIDESVCFSGSFDGCGFEISGMQISNSEVENQGLFGSIITINSDTIRDLTVSGTMSVSNVNTGGIAGNASGYNFSKCVNKVTINSSSTELGGIVGYAYSCTIEGCVNEGPVTSTYNGALNACVGGIVGYITDTQVTKCYNSADITAESSMTVGGIIGYETGSPSYLNNDYNVNTGTITGQSYVAGIIGYASTKYPSFGYCANYGKIIATEGDVGLISNSSSSGINIFGCLSAGSEEVTNICYVVDANDSITCSIYDNTILVVDDQDIIDSNSGGVFGYSTQELISGEEPKEFVNGLEGYEYSFAPGRYPIPNIEEDLPGGYWEKIVVSVTRQ